MSWTQQKSSNLSWNLSDKTFWIRTCEEDLTQVLILLNFFIDMVELSMEKIIASVPGYTFCSTVVLYGIGVSFNDGKWREAWLLTHHFPVVYRCPDDNI